MKKDIKTTMPQSPCKEMLWGDGRPLGSDLKDFLTPYEDSCFEGNFEKAKSGFTLAETLIVVAILGVIAVLVIPNLIRNQIESQNRIKVKKAMSVYERALNKIVIENDLRNNTALINYNNSAENANCADTSKYFKASQGQGCMFKTSDGVWWDITNIQRPIIYLNKEGITANNQGNVIDHAKNTNEQEDKDAYKAFILVGRFDDTIGALRINDKAYEDANSVTEDYDNGTSTSAKMAKLYGFMSNKKENNEINLCSSYCKFMGNDYSQSCEITENYPTTSSCTTCKACTYKTPNGLYTVYDGNGKQIISCWHAYQGVCQGTMKYDYDANGNKIEEGLKCDGQGENCTGSGYIYEYDSNGRRTLMGISCKNGDKNNCTSYMISTYDSNGRPVAYGDGCTSTDMSSCSRSSVSSYDSKGNEVAYGSSCTSTDISSCSNYSVYNYDTNGYPSASGNGCTSTDMSSCSNYSVYNFNTNGNNTTSGYGCTSTDISSCSDYEVHNYDTNGNNTVSGYDCTSTDVNSCSFVALTRYDSDGNPTFDAYGCTSTDVTSCSVCYDITTYSETSCSSL